MDNTVFVVDAGDAADQGVNADGPLLRLAPALGGKFLAGLTAAGRLVVWLADFTKVGQLQRSGIIVSGQAYAGCSCILVAEC